MLYTIYPFLPENHILLMKVQYTKKKPSSSCENIRNCVYLWDLIRSNAMQVVRWQESTAPQEQELRRRMQQQGLSPYSWSNGPSDTYAVHSHSYEKVLYCVRGSIRF